MPAVNHRDQNSPIVSSEDVHDFYERMPYPAPLTNLEEHRDLYKNPARRAAQFHLLWPNEPQRSNREILVAGCGTSQAARYALREPEARVTAIDISGMSLRHTRDLKQKYGLENLEIHRLSIEEVSELGRSFDQIVCTGVLHHLPDPILGLRSLREVLNVEGAMNLMVYAPYGRAGIYMIQEYCRLLGIKPADADLKELGQVLQALPANHPIANAMRGALDFNYPDAIADALLHPLDRAYSVPQLYEWLDDCGMLLGRWVEQSPYLPECGIIAKTPHAARLSLLSPPLQHAAVELFRGTMVRHKFIAYRNDRVGPAQPVTFDGDRWRAFVPIVIPWTVCVRERLPPGSVAVLINRAHPFNDLILTVDAFEDKLLRVIDGKRSLDEIIDRSVGRTDDHRALRFFKRLWQYDQIVFDASRSN